MTNPFDRTLYLGYDIDDRVPYATYGRFLGASRDAYVSAFIFLKPLVVKVILTTAT